MILFWKDREKHLVSLFRKGDNYAMDKLYMEYADYLTGVCARYISDEDTLKDGKMYCRKVSSRFSQRSASLNTGEKVH